MLHVAQYLALTVPQQTTVAALKERKLFGKTKLNDEKNDSARQIPLWRTAVCWRVVVDILMIMFLRTTKVEARSAERKIMYFTLSF